LSARTWRQLHSLALAATSDWLDRNRGASLSSCALPAVTARPPFSVPPLDAEQTRWFLEEVQPHEAALRAYLRVRFPTLRDIDDLVQDTYARLIRAYSSGQVSQPKAYLFAAARNAALDFFRREKIVSIEHLAEIHELPVLEERPDAAEKACHDQELAILAEAIRALPSRCREIITLRKLRGLSHAEIAQMLGISEHTVNAQLAIGVLRCREYLRSRGVLKGRPHVIAR
jgi:RNA polymerase sigma factor (sigma-70 family)